MSTAQMTRFDGVARDDLVERILDRFLRPAWPAQILRWDPDALRTFIRGAVAVAVADGFLAERDLAHYTNIAFAIRSDLDELADPHAVDWVVLNRGDRSQPPAARVTRMYVQLYRQYDRQAAGRTP